MLGTVKWFNQVKGYGFIVPEDGSADVFVHKTSAKSSSVLVDGAKVLFEVGPGKKGPQALNVRAA